MEIYAASYLLPIASPPVEGGAIAVENGRIKAVGRLADLRAEFGAPVREFPGCVIMPGLVNAHTHLELTHFPSWKLRKDIDYSPRTYVDWVVQVIKIRRALSHDELAVSSREGIRMCLESGTTAVGDILTDRSLLPQYAASPLTGRLFLEAIGQDPFRCAALKSELERSLDAFPCGALLPGLSPHAPHTLAPDFLQDVVAMARKRFLPAMIHLSESREETAFLHDSSGRIAENLYPLAGWESYIPPPRHTTSTAWLDSLGVIGPATVAVHCVHVTPSDVRILRERGATCVLCPRSNDRLDVGKAPAALLKKEGVPLALGTDSLASNDSLSMWDEMRFAIDAYPVVFTPAELLEMSTIGAAKALQLEEEIGSLESGKRADFLVVHPGRPGQAHGIVETLLEESRVEEVFCGGERVS
ncbi:MAG: amidohydrolase family protein [Geobacter sp.]|nr:amidohydrolase family protein [Geobacter sp.]